MQSWEYSPESSLARQGAPHFPGQLWEHTQHQVSVVSLSPPFAHKNNMCLDHPGKCEIAEYEFPLLNLLRTHISIHRKGNRVVPTQDIHWGSMVAMNKSSGHLLHLRAPELTWLGAHEPWALHAQLQLLIPLPLPQDPCLSLKFCPHTPTTWEWVYPPLYAYFDFLPVDLAAPPAIQMCTVESMSFSVPGTGRKQ